MSVTSSLPRYAIQSSHSVKVGILAPLTGNVSSWGSPGLNGCLIWANQVNRSGGILADGQRRKVEIISYDCKYDPIRAVAGAKELVQEVGVKFLLMLGGDTFSPVRAFLNKKKILTSTLLPSDLSPDTPYLIAASETHPIYNVTAVDWISKTKPEIKTVALCSQKDALGMPSLATYRAAFEAANIKILDEVVYHPDEPNAAATVSRLMSKEPDMLCWCTSYKPAVHAFTLEAFRQGFKGQLLSCTADSYSDLIKQTSGAFMEGFVFQFPDFDDDKLNGQAINFSNPNRFYEEYNRLYPDSWSAVSWEYVSTLELWRRAVEKAGSFEPVSALAAMKEGGQAAHAFGKAEWWGEELFGINNALVGDWPVVAIENGKARIQEFRSTISWCRKYLHLLEKHMRSLNQMWDQRNLLSSTTELPLQHHFTSKLVSPKRT